MALPQDGQNANALATVKEVPIGKKLIFVDPDTNEGGIITLEDLTTQILKKLTSQTFTLDQGTKTLPAALNELNSNRLIEHIKHGQTKEIAFDNDYGCLMFVYHPYFGVGLYGFCTYDNTDVILVTTILEQPQNSISLSLKGRTLKITSKEDSAFCIFKSTFY